jgi:Flp pilus assembly protein TadD
LVSARDRGIPLAIMPEMFDGPPGGRDAALASARAAEARDHLAQGAIDDAVRCIFEAAEYAPDNTAMLREFVHALQDNDRDREAVALCEKILEIEPNNVATLIDLGFSLEPLGELERAYAAYTKASEIDPSDATSLNNRAYLELGRANLEAALADVTAALARNEFESIAHATHAEILAQLGRIDESFAAVSKAVEQSDEWLETAKTSDFLEPLREDDRWDRWLAERTPALGDT